ncbi:aldo/keto reductase [Cognatishimia sp. SS12]|uniref:aldo/keto reductase n=1 Tax=Cognatishimia sp. SS12 TaxID=2979465 RepID=UPI00232F6E0B|nr:aldo/keto reductase [Cognatishimia sp. SS12]MDC0736851.1 aldo/keto reductase [Cognatishimia sp. SS12]
MKRNRLGRTDIEVSALCLGTMTYGTQTPIEDAHQQMDMALTAGIDFWDTAEMYPVNPVAAEHQGRSEEFIGSWFEKSGRRNEVILATKHSGEGMKIVRDGAPISSATIPEAIDGSLKRLKTDYIDLYQFHWPNRGSYMFRKNWTFDPSDQPRAETLDNMADCLEALQKEVARGRIRAFGLSNESAWGMAQWVRLAEEMGAPRAASIQNEYSLLCRLYDTDLAELSHQEDVGLMAFSPLATGLLTGKYQGGAVPEGSRLSIGRNLGGRMNDRTLPITQLYLDLAARHDLDPVHMALAWCMQRPFMMSAIFGATTAAQLEHIIAGKDLVLSDAVMREIDQIHQSAPAPY